MSESAREYGGAPGMALGRDAREPKTKVELARALGRAEERVQTLETQVSLATMELRQAHKTIREIEEILDGKMRFVYSEPTPTRSHRLAYKAVADAQKATSASQALANELASIAAALNRGATLTKFGPGEGYVCERGLLRCTGEAPYLAAEAFLKEDKAPAAEAKPQ